jgi:PAS domain S-box-containing protein
MSVTRTAFWRRVFKRLIEPPQFIVKPGLRRRVRLLSSLLLTLLVLTIIHISALVVLRPQIAPTRWLDFSVLLFLVLAYIVTRTRSYLIGAGLTIGALMIVPHMAAINRLNVGNFVGARDILAWTAWGIILSHLLLPLRGTLTVITANLIGLLFFLPALMSANFATATALAEMLMVLSALVAVAALISHRDLKQMDRQSQDLTRSEQQYRNLLENANDAIIIFEPVHEIILEVNNKACAIYGISRDEFVGGNLKLLTKDVRQGEAAINDLLQLGTIKSFETIHYRRDGTPMNLLANGSVIEYAGRTAIMSINHDITERKRAEETLRRSEIAEREERLLAEALRDVITVLTSTLDLDSVMGRILENVGRVVPHDNSNIMLIDGEIARSAYWFGDIGESEAFFKKFTLPLATPNLQELITKNAPAIISDTEADPYWKPLPETRWIRSYVGAPLRAHGKIIGFLHLHSRTPGFFTTLHAEHLQIFANQAAIAIENAQLYAEIRRRADELEQHVADRTAELTTANAQLKELDYLKSKFIADMSHELRTPVSNLNLRLHLLERDTPENQGEHIRILKNQFIRLNQLLESVLDFSKLDENGKTNNPVEIVNLNALIEEELATLQPRADAAGLGLIFTPDLTLPLITGRANELSRVILNLVTNAINYTPEGQVEIRTGCCGQQVYMEVKDTGVGITPEDLPHLFQRFYRGQQVGSSNIPGTGLGLNIVQGIVEMHEGMIEVESEIDKGSIFRVRLPVHSQNEEKPFLLSA